MLTRKKWNNDSLRLDLPSGATICSQTQSRVFNSLNMSLTFHFHNFLFSLSGRYSHPLLYIISHIVFTFFLQNSFPYLHISLYVLY